MYREMQANAKVNLKKQLSLLWRPELAHIQSLNGMAKYTHRASRDAWPAGGRTFRTLKYKEKSKKFVIEKIEEKVPMELFERDYNLIAEQIQEFRIREGRNTPGVRKRRYRRK
jgi:hypothetical protein